MRHEVALVVIVVDARRHDALLVIVSIPHEVAFPLHDLVDCCLPVQILPAMLGTFALQELLDEVVRVVRGILGPMICQTSSVTGQVGRAVDDIGARLVALHW